MSATRVRPAADRFAKRCIVLSALAYRANLELEATGTTAADLREVGDWLKLTGADAELEPSEREYLYAPMGGNTEQRAVEAAWRIESLGVLAWSLGRFALPPFDEPVDPRDVVRAIGFAQLPLETVLASPVLRPVSEIDALTDLLFVLRWRLEFFARDGLAIDITDTLRSIGTSPTIVASLPVAEGDLAIGEVPLAKAPADAVEWCLDSVDERQHALEWLLGNRTAFDEGRMRSILTEES